MPLDPKLPCVACILVVHVPFNAVIPTGVKVGTCGGCQAPVMVSPSSRQLVADGIAQVACHACAAKHSPHQAGVMTPAAVKELTAWTDADRN
jgi:hypothetical protein